MKKIILIILVILSATVVSFGSEYQPMVVEGRTWWYKSIELTSDYKRIPIVVGIRIGEATAEEPEWHPCLAVDSNYQKVLDPPVAWLKEANKKIWVRPNLNLDKEAGEVETREAKLMRDMLGYWYGNNIKLYDDREFDNTSWNPTNQTEFLLYDFNYEIGEIYDWLWTGRLLSGHGRVDFSTGIFEITYITEKSINTGPGQSRTVKSYSLLELEEDADSSAFAGRLYILEGIGVTEGSPSPILGSSISWEGFFFAPDAFTYVPAESCIRYYEYIPVLTMVEDPDGQIIYSNKPFQAGINESPISPEIIDSKIYDLHGREITNPQPRSIYIRNGKKFVAK